jgi:hypothetical protein
MKLFAKLMIALLVLALLLPFTFLKDDKGDTLMSFSDFRLPDFSLADFSLPDMPGFSSSKSKVSSDEDLAGKDLFYKWYDAEGNVQFTTEPPADGIEYTVKGFDPDANVIQAVKIPVSEAEVDDSKPDQSKNEPGESTENPYSLEKIKKLFEDTKNLKTLLNQRAQDQDSTINQ